MSGSSCIGATAGGTITELIALGAADKYLTLKPTITFWRFRYNKYTNFAMESIEQPFISQVAFGQDVTVTLNRTGDMVHFMYLIVDIPGIKGIHPTNQNFGYCGVGPSSQFPACDPCDPNDDGSPPECECCPASSVPDDDADFDSCTGVVGPWAHWTNAIGQFIIRKVCVIIGGVVIDSLVNDYLFMWEELSGKPGKRLTEMIGKRFTRAQLIADSSKDRRLYVPLPFWFTLSSGNSLPLVSLTFHTVQLSVCFENLQRCVLQSDRNVVVLKCRDCQPLTNNDLQARLDTTFVYLDVCERDRYAKGNFEQLITQVQYYTMSHKGNHVRIQLNFNHPIIELIFAVRRRSNEVCNNWFNYSGKWGQDPIKAVHLRLNNQPRFGGREGKYFRLVQPYQFHTDVPEGYIYCYSFALDPESTQPTGSANFSRIDNVELVLELQEELSDEEVRVIVFGRNLNIFRYRKGLGGLAFQS